MQKVAEQTLKEKDRDESQASNRTHLISEISHEDCCWVKKLAFYEHPSVYRVHSKAKANLLASGASSDCSSFLSLFGPGVSDTEMVETASAAFTRGVNLDLDLTGVRDSF